MINNLLMLSLVAAAVLLVGFQNCSSPFSAVVPPVGLLQNETIRPATNDQMTSNSAESAPNKATERYFGFFAASLGVHSNLPFVAATDRHVVFIGAGANRSFVDPSCQHEINGLATRLCWLGNKIDDVTRLNKPGVKVALMIGDLFYDSDAANRHTPRQSLQRQAQNISGQADAELERFSSDGYLSQRTIFATMFALHKFVFENYPARKAAIQIVYPLDEPYLAVPAYATSTATAYNLRFGEIRTLAQTAKDFFPGAKVLEVFSRTELLNDILFPNQSPEARGWSMIPAEVDLVAFDCYTDCSFTTSDMSRNIYRLVDRLRKLKYIAQKIVLVPDAGLELSSTVPATSCDFSWAIPHLEDRKSKLHAYFDLFFTYRNMDIVGLFPFIWQDLPAASGVTWCGVNHFPDLQNDFHNYNKWVYRN